MGTPSAPSNAIGAWPRAGVAVAAIALGLVARSPAAGPEIEVARVLLGAFWLWTAARVGRWWAESGGDANLPAPASGHLARGLLAALIYALGTSTLAGALGRFDLLSLTVVHALVFGVCPRSSRRNGYPTPGQLLRAARRNPVHASLAAVVIAIGIANGAWAILSPVYHIDDLVYHLTFPVEWAQQKTISSRLIPFGNHSPSYHPKNAELLLAWLFLPLRRIEIVSLLQVAYLTGSVAAAYHILRLCRVSAAASFVVAPLLLLSSAVVRFVDSGYVDFAFMFGLLMSIAALLRMGRAPTWRAWIELWCAVGFFCGTKAFGLPFLALLLVPLGAAILSRAARQPSTWAPSRLVPGIGIAVALWLAAGGWWYVRNVLTSGNPIFPMRVEFAGRQLFDGPYSRAAFESARLQTLRTLLPSPLWLPLGIGIAGTLLAALARPARRGARALAVLSVLVPLVMAAIYTLLLPTGYPRFVLAIVPLTALSLAAPLESRLARPFTLVLAAALAWTLISKAPNVLLPLRGGSLLSTPLVLCAFGLTCAALLLTGLLITVQLPRKPIWLAATALLCAVGLNLAARTSDPAGPHVPERVVKAWQPYLELERDHGPSHIAVTGTNQTLRSYGRAYGSHVGYVNINDTGTAQFHDHYRQRRESVTADLTDPSGARYYRAEPDYDAWIRNLEQFGAQLLIVGKLPIWAREQPYVRDARSFPIERRWADDHPERFQPIPNSSGLRFYQVLSPR